MHKDWLYSQFFWFQSGYTFKHPPGLNPHVTSGKTSKKTSNTVRFESEGFTVPPPPLLKVKKMHYIVWNRILAPFIEEENKHPR